MSVRNHGSHCLGRRPGPASVPLNLNLDLQDWGLVSPCCAQNPREVGGSGGRGPQSRLWPQHLAEASLPNKPTEPVRPHWL